MMELGEIAWQIVPNTVASRMLDSSLTHKLVSSRKIQQRTKVMNKAIKQLGNINTYKQYVNIKTLLLRKLVNDNETDNESSFTDNDYSITYKSDASLTKYLTQMSKKDCSYFDDDKSEVDDDLITSDTDNGKLAPQTLKTEELGWKTVLKKGSDVTRNINISQGNNELCLTGENNEKLLLDTSNPSSVCLENVAFVNEELHIVGRKEDLCMENVDGNSKEMLCDINSVQEGIQNCNQSVQLHTMVNEISQELQAEKDPYSIMSDSVETPILERKKKMNRTRISDNVNIFANQDLSLNQNDSSWLSIQNNVEAASGDNNKNGKLHKISSIVRDFNQPKDSGFEEDSDEEPYKHGGKHYAKMIHKKHKAEENCTLLNATNSEVMAISLNKGGNKKIEKISKKKHRLVPKVVHMETVQQKYKNMMRNKYLPANIKSTSSQNCDMQNARNDFIHEREEIRDNTEDTVPLSTKKRLSHLKRLNLTIESDSSISDSEDTKCAVKSMRDKLLKRSTEYSELPNSEGINGKSGSIILTYASKKLHSDETLKMEKCKEMKASSVVTKNRKYIQNNESLIQTSFSSINNKDKKEKYTKVEHASLNADNIVPQEANLECDESANVHHEKCVKELGGQCMEIASNQKTLQSEDHKAITRLRPYNLQELIEEENLRLDTGSATFTLEDIGEHELLIIDIPSVVFDKQLIGSKIILRKDKLKLGKQKYNVEYKNVGNVSCVFASKSSHMVYETVNVKPLANIIAHRRI